MRIETAAAAALTFAVISARAHHGSVVPLSDAVEAPGGSYPV
ncbi:MAG TPA: hypothetical protein VIV14_11050 [Gammaproteobacteria bacterium]